MGLEGKRGVRDNAKVSVSATEAGVPLSEMGKCRMSGLGKSEACREREFSRMWGPWGTSPGPLWGEFSPLSFPAGPCPHLRLTLA